MCSMQVDAGNILHLLPDKLLPDGHMLAVHRDLNLIAVMFCNEHPLLVNAQQFSSYEMMLLLPILLSYPEFCHYETLYAAFSGGTTEKDVEKARIRLSRAKERGEWEAEMRPIRNLLSRARLKLHSVGITILSVFETGYILQAFTEKNLGYKRTIKGARVKEKQRPGRPIAVETISVQNIALARKLLEEGNHTTAEVMQLTGFRNKNTFSKYVLSAMQHTPSQATEVAPTDNAIPRFDRQPDRRSHL